MPGPAFLAAWTPGRTKMPTPMMQPMPIAVRSQAVRARRNLCPSTSVSAMIRVMGFVRNSQLFMRAPLFYL